MQRRKLLIVYSPNSPAAEFVLQGVNLRDVEILKVQFEDSIFYKITYLLLYKLGLYKLASFFRFKPAFRKRISAQKGKILFWDCCDLFIYKLLNAECKSAIAKSVFFWNPLGLHKTERVSVDKMIVWLKRKGFLLSTFDPDDSETFNLPLFCNVNRRVALPKTTEDNDFYFVGLPKGREKELEGLKEKIKQGGFRFKFIMPKNRDEYVTPLQNIQYSSESKCIVDLISKKFGQSGLTLRPFDALFLKRKLLTNCKSIVDYDFYHENNILVFSENTSLDDIDQFIKKPYHDIGDDIVDKYEINCWLKNYYLS